MSYAAPIAASLAFFAAPPFPLPKVDVFFLVGLSDVSTFALFTTLTGSVASPFSTAAPFGCPSVDGPLNRPSNLLDQIGNNTL